MAMDGSPPSKKKKLCKDVGGFSEEDSQSTTSPEKSQEKLSPRHSDSSSQEQTPSAGTSRTSEETEELHTCSKCGASFTSNLSLVYHLLKIHQSGSLSQEQTSSAGTSQSPICDGDLSVTAELIALLQPYCQEIEQTPSAGTLRTSEETEESHTCPKCGESSKSILWLAFHLLIMHK
ncbi:hypothetical protein DBV15_03192 [Temnothorax longispinosus]|uniref:C2H2-type domain-containing protein n=1 Tax=Temnothorax longispinosus TaxID=300112 RepID=A0A4V3SCM5_9HYME|nr:hypothetical protein DBV15_03192 [Temnothorax longispinosus]